MLIQSIKMAWAAIRGNKMRSFLTMLGIIIGVTALVVLVSLVDGATGAITSEVESLGNDMLTVSILDDKGAPLRLEDLSEMAALEEVSKVSPSGTLNTSAKYLSNETNVSAYGVTPAYGDIQGLELERGRFIKSADVDNRTYVAVLTYETAETLFDEAQAAMGKRISLGGRSFEVVGVLRKDDSMMASMMGENAVYIPFSVESRMAGAPYITALCVSSRGETADAESALSAWLLRRLQQDEEAFSVSNMSSISDAMGTITSTLSLLLGGIAAISLLVGGIGIMNIMLVSVTERTREIGIRKAIGAGRRSIMAQFLIEALMVSLLGCLFGLILSAGILALASAMAGSMAFAMSPSVVALSVAFSSGVGLLFGLYPANKAAKKHPIEALRYEG